MNEASLDEGLRELLFGPFLSRATRKQLRRSEGLIDQQAPHVVNRGRGVCLMCDISGFTALGCRLVSESTTSRSAADQLTDRIGVLLEALVFVVEGMRGDVSKFAGDALICTFDCSSITAADQHTTATNHGEDTNVMGETSAFEYGIDATLETLAKRCAVTLLLTIERIDPSLGAHIGISNGQLLDIHVGMEDDTLRWTLLAGGAIVAASEFVSLAKRGEIICNGKLVPPASINAVTSLPPCESLTPWITDQCLVYLPAELVSICESSGTQPMAELRNGVAVVFVNLCEVDQRNFDIDVLNNTFSCLAEITEMHLGQVRDFLFEDKGCTFIATFGAYSTINRSALAATRAAFDISRVVPNTKIGCAVGTCFCGCVGSKSRRDFMVFGDQVNMSARLMGKAAVGTVLVSEEVHRDSMADFKFERIENLKLKGMSSMAPVYKIVWSLEDDSADSENEIDEPITEAEHSDRQSTRQIRAPRLLTGDRQRFGKKRKRGVSSHLFAGRTTELKALGSAFESMHPAGEQKPAEPSNKDTVGTLSIAGVATQNSEQNPASENNESSAISTESRLSSPTRRDVINNEKCEGAKMMNGVEILPNENAQVRYNRVKGCRVLVLGESGIGKTALVAEFISRLRLRNTQMACQSKVLSVSLRSEGNDTSIRDTGARSENIGFKAYFCEASESETSTPYFALRRTVSKLAGFAKLASVAGECVGTPEIDLTPFVKETIETLGFELDWSLRVLAVILSGKIGQSSDCHSSTQGDQSPVRDAQKHSVDLSSSPVGGKLVGKNALVARRGSPRRGGLGSQISDVGSHHFLLREGASRRAAVDGIMPGAFGSVQVSHADVYKSGLAKKMVLVLDKVDFMDSLTVAIIKQLWEESIDGIFFIALSCHPNPENTLHLGLYNTFQANADITLELEEMNEHDATLVLTNLRPMSTAVHHAELQILHYAHLLFRRKKYVSAFARRHRPKVPPKVLAQHVKKGPNVGPEENAQICKSVLSSSMTRSQDLQEHINPGQGRNQNRNEASNETTPESRRGMEVRTAVASTRSSKFRIDERVLAYVVIKAGGFPYYVSLLVHSLFCNNHLNLERVTVDTAAAAAAALNAVNGIREDKERNAVLLNENGSQGPLRSCPASPKNLSFHEVIRFIQRRRSNESVDDNTKDSGVRVHGRQCFVDRKVSIILDRACRRASGVGNNEVFLQQPSGALSSSDDAILNLKRSSLDQRSCYQDKCDPLAVAPNELPSTLIDAVVRRLDCLPPLCRTLIKTAAVFGGQHFDSQSLYDIMARASDEALSPEGYERVEALRESLCINDEIENDFDTSDRNMMQRAVNIAIAVCVQRGIFDCVSERGDIVRYSPTESPLNRAEARDLMNLSAAADLNDKDIRASEKSSSVLSNDFVPKRWNGRLLYGNAAGLIHQSIARNEHRSAKWQFRLEVLREVAYDVLPQGAKGSIHNKIARLTIRRLNEVRAELRGSDGPDAYNADGVGQSIENTGKAGMKWKRRHGTVLSLNRSVVDLQLAVSRHYLEGHKYDHAAQYMARAAEQAFLQTNSIQEASLYFTWSTDLGAQMLMKRLQKQAQSSRPHSVAHVFPAQGIFSTRRRQTISFAADLEVDNNVREMFQLFPSSPKHIRRLESKNDATTGKDRSTSGRKRGETSTRGALLSAFKSMINRRQQTRVSPGYSRNGGKQNDLEFLQTMFKSFSRSGQFEEEEVTFDVQGRWYSQLAWCFQRLGQNCEAFGAATKACECLGTRFPATQLTPWKLCKSRLAYSFRVRHPEKNTFWPNRQLQLTQLERITYAYAALVGFQAVRAGVNGRDNVMLLKLHVMLRDWGLLDGNMTKEQKLLLVRKAELYFAFEAGAAAILALFVPSIVPRRGLKQGPRMQRLQAAAVASVALAEVASVLAVQSYFVARRTLVLAQLAVDRLNAAMTELSDDTCVSACSSMHFSVAGAGTTLEYCQAAVLTASSTALRAKGNMTQATKFLCAALEKISTNRIAAAFSNSNEMLTEIVSGAVVTGRVNDIVMLNAAFEHVALIPMPHSADNRVQALQVSCRHLAWAWTVLERGEYESVFSVLRGGWIKYANKLSTKGDFSIASSTIMHNPEHVSLSSSGSNAKVSNTRKREGGVGEKMTTTTHGSHPITNDVPSRAELEEYGLPLFAVVGTVDVLSAAMYVAQARFDSAL